MRMFTKLFSPIRLANQEVRNRIVMPPMGTNYANSDGTIGEPFIRHYLERAKSGVGLIIVEVTSVDYPKGKTIAKQVKLNDYNDLPGWIDLADSVHAFGAKIICQLHHAGYLSSYDKALGHQPVAPSTYSNYGEVAREMTTEEVEALIEKFVKSAVLAQRAGLDGVEIHAGHGYLISQFLSKARNQRTDKYGGDIQGRSRMLLEIIDGVRKACGKNFILSVRLGVVDTLPDGNSLDDGVIIAQLVDDAGVDIINVTTGVLGLPSTGVETQFYEEGHRLPMAKAVKAVVKNAAVSIVGKIREPEMCEQILEDGIADLVAIGRSQLCDPMWVHKVEYGKLDEIRKCISCSEGCFGNLVFRESTVRCALNPYLGLERPVIESDVSPVGKPKKVLIIGGGVSGMQAAITAAQRGHQVILSEKSKELGGQLNIAQVPMGKAVIGTARDWFISELTRQGVEVKLEAHADATFVKDINPDAVIVACGSLPNLAPIAGLADAVPSWDILNGACPLPKDKNIVVIGGGTVGCETAIILAQNGNTVKVLEQLADISAGQEMTHKIDMTIEMQKLGIEVITNALVQSVKANEVIYKNKEGGEERIAIDTAISSTGQKSVGKELCKELKAQGYVCRLVGDSLKVGNIRGAVREGFEAGYSI